MSEQDWKSILLNTAELAAKSVNQCGESPRPPRHTAEGITAVISGLEGLAETLPAIVAAGTPVRCSDTTAHRTTYKLNDAIAMLQEYRADIESEARARKNQESRELVNAAWENGYKVGVADEQKRVREVRAGKRGKK